MEQRFIIEKGPKAGVVAAIALVKGSFYSRITKTTVPTQDLVDIVGFTDQSPEFPKRVLGWVEAEDSLRDVTQMKA